MNFKQKKVMIGLSGGINSMALLCWLGELPTDHHPCELHLFYADFKEHSPDTLKFVLDGWSWAESRFEKVFYKQTSNSVMDFFEDYNFIPHPTNSKCSHELKILPMLKYCYEHQIDIDLVGYVSKEKARLKKVQSKRNDDLFFRKEYPIMSQNDDWCFEIVKKHIGWYPAIYDITENGKRVFSHNNCLPCKNMTSKQFSNVAKYYPSFFERAIEVEQNTGSYFGRNKCDTGCAVCDFD